MAQSGLDLSLDEIIKENRARSRDKTPVRGGRGRGRGTRGAPRGRISQSNRGRGGVAKRVITRGQGNIRGQGNVRGRGSGLRGRGNINRGRGAVQRQSRSRTPVRMGQNTVRRSVSRGRFQNNQNNAPNIQLRSRSRSRTRFQNANVQPNPQPRARSRSRSRTRIQPNIVQQNIRSRSRSRSQNRFNAPQAPRRSRSRTPGRNPNNLPKTGIAARLGINKQFTYSNVGLRSDMILRAKQNKIKSQTFTRSGSLPKSQDTYTVSVANDRVIRKPINRRRNSFTAANNAGYLDQNINNLATSIGGVNLRGRSGSLSSPNAGKPVRSLRGRGRGRGAINYASKQILNPQLQMEIAVLQGKSYKDGKIINSATLGSSGINFIPTPHLTTTKLSDRFNCL